jgi:hypothetical protein
MPDEDPGVAQYAGRIRADGPQFREAPQWWRSWTALRARDPASGFGFESLIVAGLIVFLGVTNRWMSWQGGYRQPHGAAR